MKAARIHYLAASHPYLPPNTASLHIAAPWGGTTVQLYFLPNLGIHVYFVRSMECLMHCHRYIGAAAPCLCTPASLRARSCTILHRYRERHYWRYNRLTVA